MHHRLRVGTCVFGLIVMVAALVTLFAPRARAAVPARVAAATDCVEDGDSGTCINGGDSGSSDPAASGGSCCGGSTHDPGYSAPQPAPAPLDTPVHNDPTPAAPQQSNVPAQGASAPARSATTPKPETNFLPAAETPSETPAAPTLAPTIELAAGPIADSDIVSRADATTPVGSSSGNGIAQAVGVAVALGGAVLGASVFAGGTGEIPTSATA